LCDGEASFSFEGRMISQRERYFFTRCDRAALPEQGRKGATSLPLRWWTRDELTSSPDPIFPPALGAHLVAIERSPRVAFWFHAPGLRLLCGLSVGPATLRINAGAFIGTWIAALTGGAWAGVAAGALIFALGHFGWSVYLRSAVQDGRAFE
jgi:hypothetical protein